MPMTGGAKSQSLYEWARQLHNALNRQDGADIAEVQHTLLGMADDPVLPTAISDAAMLEHVGTLDGAVDVARIMEFLDRVHPQSTAFIGPEGVEDVQSAPMLRNFGPTAAHDPSPRNAEPFVRAIQDELMRSVGFGARIPQYQPLLPAPQDRPPVDPMPDFVLKMARRIVANPAESAAEHKQYVLDKKIRSTDDSAKELVRLGRKQVAFGLSHEKDIQLMDYLRNAMGASNKEAFTNSINAVMRSEPYNSRVAPLLFDAAKTYLERGGLLADIGTANLAPLVPEPERRFIEALSKRPDATRLAYATLGIVSPTGPAPDITEALALAGPQALATEPAPMAALQRLLQTPMPMPKTMPVPEADTTGSDVKRQRTTGDFVTVSSSVAELGAQSLNPQVVVERLPMAQLQASMPLQPAPAVAALPTAQTTEIVAPTPTVPS
ncbi:MAG: hypothetical protein JWQ41_1843 [Variovorax sp.]|nr:hypothetical protein [Variovorax sp.]